MFGFHRLATSWDIAFNKIANQYPELFTHPKKVLLVPGLVSYLQQPWSHISHDPDRSSASSVLTTLHSMHSKEAMVVN